MERPRMEDMMANMMMAMMKCVCTNNLVAHVCSCMKFAESLDLVVPDDKKMICKNCLYVMCHFCHGTDENFCKACILKNEDHGEEEYKVYDQGYKDGLEEGHKEGHKEGHEEGHEEGYKKGHEEGYKEGYHQGIYNKGFFEGRFEGYTRGYIDRGHEEEKGDVEEKEDFKLDEKMTSC